MKKNNVVIAAFTFDGDGKRVKSAINGTTTLFVGGGYEIKNPGTGQEITKYYFAGASRVATPPRWFDRGAPFVVKYLQ